MHNLVGSHPNIITLLGAFEDNKAVYMVCPVCKQGEIPVYLARKRQVSERDIVHLFAQIMEAIDHIHKHGMS